MKRKHSETMDEAVAAMAVIQQPQQQQQQQQTITTSSSTTTVTLPSFKNFVDSIVVVDNHKHVENSPLTKRQRLQEDTIVSPMTTTTVITPVTTTDIVSEQSVTASIPLLPQRKFSVQQQTIYAPEIVHAQQQHHHHHHHQQQQSPYHQLSHDTFAYTIPIGTTTPQLPSYVQTMQPSSKLEYPPPSYSSSAGIQAPSFLHFGSSPATQQNTTGTSSASSVSANPTTTSNNPMYYYQGPPPTSAPPPPNYSYHHQQQQRQQFQHQIMYTSSPGTSPLSNSPPSGQSGQYFMKYQHQFHHQPQQQGPPQQPQIVQATVPAPISPNSDEDSNSNSEFTDLSLLEDNVNPQQLQPIRVLAYKVGLSKDPNKSWRYRDIKRSLFEKISPQHANFIEKNLEHSLLKQRLPHKLSMCSFSKRIMLLVYHFIVRDGKEPKFWRRASVKVDVVEQILKEHDQDFYFKINKQAALEVHSYIVAGMSIDRAIQHQQNIANNMTPIDNQ
jgi:hypothetical protein